MKPNDKVRLRKEKGMTGVVVKVNGNNITVKFDNLTYSVVENVVALEKYET